MLPQHLCQRRGRAASPVLVVTPEPRVVPSLSFHIPYILGDCIGSGIKKLYLGITDGKQRATVPSVGCARRVG